jgi:hypothetical protein
VNRRQNASVEEDGQSRADFREWQMAESDAMSAMAPAFRECSLLARALIALVAPRR